MNIVCVGGGPGGLYFAVLMKKANPDHHIRVIERNRADDTFGFGVVFSEATMAGIAQADSEAYEAIAQHLVHWNDIEVRRNGDTVRSAGHGFSGMSRHTLLSTLQKQARDVGVEVVYECEVKGLDELGMADLIVASDGVNSTIRRLLEPGVTTTVDLRPNRFVWLGTTKPLPAFTFFFRRTSHGLWRVHSYQYEPGHSTFIVECREETWRAAGMDRATEEETAAFLEGVFSAELAGHRLITNRSLWRQFPTIRTAPWSMGNVVLMGDAAHTAHFSVGSGTRMAMEDAVALRDALEGFNLPGALAAYETARRPKVESLQRAAQASLEWFENTERYMTLEPVQFAFSLLTRSLRITHEDLRARDPELLRRVDQAVAAQAAAQSGVTLDTSAFPPQPMLTPFRLRELVIPNRVVVSAMGGDVAIGDAGLVLAGPTGGSTAAEWKRLVEFVHGESSAKIGLKLGDVTDYAHAVQLALESGFDLVELNGGSLDAFDACRRAWPVEKPLSVRIDALRRTAAEAVELARALRARGCDIVHVAPAGHTMQQPQPRQGRQFLTPLAERIRHEAGIPTIASGNISTTMDINTIVAAGRADLCVLAPREFEFKFRGKRN
jgi:anthraniloyl-CoA monooxygenase